MPAVTFPTEPTRREQGVPVYVSACKKFRLIHCPGLRPAWYAHYMGRRFNGYPQWIGVHGLPFDTREAAIAACQEIADRNRKKPRRERFGHIKGMAAK